MSSVRLDDFPGIDRSAPNIASWQEVDLTALSSREKKYYTKRKSAVQEYFTSQEHADEIAYRHHLSPKTLRRLIKKCMMRHEDGMPWGYRALVPGVTVIDASSASTSEITTHQTPAGAMSEQPCPEDDKGSGAHFDTIVSLEDHDQEQNSPDEPTTDPHLDIEKSLSTIPTTPVTTSAQEQAALDDEGSEDDENDKEDTAKRERLSIPSVSATPSITPIPTSFVDEDELTTEEIPAEIEINDSLAEDDPCEDVRATLEVTLDQNVDVLDQPTPLSSKDEPDSGGDPEASSTMTGPVAEELALTHVEASAERNGAGLNPSRPSPQQSEAERVSILRTYRPTLLHRAPVHKGVNANRMVRKRWVRSVQQQRKQRRYTRILSAIVVASLLFIILIPVGTGLAAYSAYTNIRGIALDGVNNLLAVKSLIPVSKSDPTAALDPVKLQQAQNDLTRAQGDFLQLQQMVNRPDIASAVQQFAPEYSGKLGMARNLVQVGLDVTHMGNELIGVALIGANILHASPLSSGSSKPLITVADISNIEGAMVHAQYYINDIQTQMSQVSVNQLPISDKQKTELTSVLTLLPQAQSLITQVQGVTGIVSWLLGVGQPRRFLVQTMDNAELRPSGGFTGQYGILSISNGRMAPFTLQDVTEIDYAGNGSELNRPAPPQYRSWMTFGNWGLRDANLSGDYPTSAKIAMQVFQEEGGGPVDGDISFTPALISHILDVTGPIQVPEYHETITAQNLENKLHYYQQNQQAIQIQRQKTGTNNAATRKAFTSLLGKILLDKVRHLSVKQLMAIMQKAVKDIQSHDLEIYFTDPQAEAWLVAHGYGDGISTFTKQDGFMVVQSNISISKASQYVHTTEQDNVVLDAQGGATHNLTITLNYQQTGPVYGYDTYADYIRVYAPANAQLISGDGFDSGKALCMPAGTKGSPGGTGTGSPGAGVPMGCSQYNSMFPSDARYCPNGNYSLGQNSYVPGKGFTSWPIDSLGTPTELTSDMPGRAMWGGLTVTPKNCISYITLSWYVPHVVKHTAVQSPYALLVQKQGGYIPTVQITVDTSALKGLKPFSFNGNLIADRVFSLPVPKKK